jgi:hypothetical protein
LVKEPLGEPKPPDLKSQGKGLQGELPTLNLTLDDRGEFGFQDEGEANPPAVSDKNCAVHPPEAFHHET